jgi:hypothetical protein
VTDRSAALCHISRPMYLWSFALLKLVAIWALRSGGSAGAPAVVSLDDLERQALELVGKLS